uniref:Interleukin-17 receptor C/E N-terminal domain-containing protein n=1 Tax=Mola mola TaxID=94237 RepID=A0A3Q3W4D0_MOLML
MLGGGEEICGQCQPVKMILWVVFLISHCCWSPNAAAASLERIEHCGTRCSQVKVHSEEHHNTHSSVFHSISLSTVMRCEGKQKCSLHLRIKTELQLTEAIHGMSICTVTPGMMANCRILGFTKGSRERMSGMQVQVTAAINGLSGYNLKNSAGRLSYDVNPQRQELNVSVSDMLQDHNYHLRLCHKDFICTGTGARTLIKKEDPVKSATFQYERLLPCLCIEGWSAVTDAPRIQVCPFKDRIEELWSGISFEPLEGKLLWEPACPVPAVVALCQIRGDGVCVDLPHASRNVKLLSLTIDMCSFLAWKLFVSRGQSQDHVKVLSQTTASFSVRLCAKSNGSTVCQATETHTMHVVGATHMLQWCNGGGVNFPLGTCVHGKELPLHACTDCIVDCVHLFFVVAGDETCFHAVRCNHFQNFLVLCKKLTVTYNFTS